MAVRFTKLQSFKAIQSFCKLREKCELIRQTYKGILDNTFKVLNFNRKQYLSRSLQLWQRKSSWWRYKQFKLSQILTKCVRNLKLNGYRSIQIAYTTSRAEIVISNISHAVDSYTSRAAHVLMLQSLRCLRAHSAISLRTKRVLLRLAQIAPLYPYREAKQKAMRALAEVLIRHYAAIIRAKSLERKLTIMVRDRVNLFWSRFRNQTT